MLKIVSIEHERDACASESFDTLTLASDKRHLRRKVLTLAGGEKVMADFAEPLVLAGGDVLVLEDGRRVRVIAAEQDLHDVRGRDALHLAELAWHIGNRHLPAQIEAGRILIERDHVIRTMLEGLGARVADIREGFSPMRGAYSGGHAHGHDHNHDHHHDHGHRHED